MLIFYSAKLFGYFFDDSLCEKSYISISTESLSVNIVSLYSYSSFFLISKGLSRLKVVQISASGKDIRCHQSSLTFCVSINYILLDKMMILNAYIISKILKKKTILLEIYSRINNLATRKEKKIESCIVEAI